jgi:hypothetical protein
VVLDSRAVPETRGVLVEHVLPHGVETDEYDVSHVERVYLTGE